VPSSSVPTVDDVDTARALIEVVPMPMLLLDTATGALRCANAAAAVELGTTVDALNTVDIAGLSFAASARDGTRVRHRRADDTVVHLEVRSQHVVVGGEPMDAIVLCDVTDQVETDRQRDHIMRQLIDEHELMRSGIAERLHDGPAQALTAVSLRLGLLRRAASPDVQAKLIEIEQLVSSALVTVRAEMNDQRKPDDLAPDLTGAIANLLVRRGLTERFTVRAAGDEPPPAMVRLLYRVAESIVTAIPAVDAFAVGETLDIVVEGDGAVARLVVPAGVDVAVDERILRLVEVIHGTVRRLDDAHGTIVVSVPVAR
jgi:signal transduction histidine kinase